ncbi:hypothetical protein NN561_003144 [Cricetulus griseus]
MVKEEEHKAFSRAPSCLGCWERPPLSAPSHYHYWGNGSQDRDSIGGGRWPSPRAGRSALPASRSIALAGPRAAPRATAEGSAAQGERSATPTQPGTDAPDHPTSFPLQFYQRLGSRAGDRRPALTRISPQIARYGRARLPRARRPRLSFVSAWPRSRGSLRRLPRKQDILLRAPPSN